MLPGSSIDGTFQARTLDWVAAFSSRGPSWPRNQALRCRQILYLWAIGQAHIPWQPTGRIDDKAAWPLQAMQSWRSRQEPSDTLASREPVLALPQESDHVKGSLKKDAIWQARDCSNGCWGIVRVQVERAGTSGFHSNQTCHRLHMGPCGQPFPHNTRGFGAVSVSNSPPPSHVTSASSGRRRRRVG